MGAVMRRQNLAKMAVLLWLIIVSEGCRTPSPDSAANDEIGIRSPQSIAGLHVKVTSPRPVKITAGALYRATRGTVLGGCKKLDLESISKWSSTTADFVGKNDTDLVSEVSVPTQWQGDKEHAKRCEWKWDAAGGATVRFTTDDGYSGEVAYTKDDKVARLSTQDTIDCARLKDSNPKRFECHGLNANGERVLHPRFFLTESMLNEPVLHEVFLDIRE